MTGELVALGGGRGNWAAEDGADGTVNSWRCVMANVHSEVPNEDPSRAVVSATWGLLMTWTGAVLLLRWGWGIGLVGAGAILLCAQAVRKHLRLRVDGFGLVAGALFVVCGVGSLFEVAVDLFPVLCLVAGIAVLVSAWTARTHDACSRPAAGHASSHPRA